MIRKKILKLPFLLFTLSLVLLITSCKSGDDNNPEPAAKVDTDNDEVEDKDDDCPNEAGLVNLNGCPDADNDGIADKDDDCPNKAGLADLKGCPDADNDGIADKDDDCPNEAGVAAQDGCPEDAEESTVALGNTLLRINAGGPDVMINDDTWVTGADYLGGALAAYEAHPSITEITNTNLDVLYLTETITSNDANNGPVSYDIPVSNGTYTIKLHFAEIYWGVQKRDAAGTEGGVGSRIFDVDIEKKSILNNFDLIEAAGGPAIAITKMYNIEVTDGELNIVFTSSVDKPKVSAIEISGDGTINP